MPRATPMKSMWAVLLAPALAACGPADAETAPPPQAMPPALVPAPRELSTLEGSFTLLDGTRVVVSPGAEPIGEALVAVLRPSTGLALDVVAGPPAPGDVELRLDAALTELGDEGYRLDVTGGGVTIAAPALAGLHYGCQTLRQLFPADVERRSRVDGAAWVIPQLAVEDTPRFAWRGAMLDVARHFFGTEDVKRYVDLITYHKMNRLHLHLTDDQGWRVEVDGWPNLTSIGGSTQVGGGPGGFYTKQDVAEIVAYAATRFVTVVPEIDMPGHIHAALASYGELVPTGEAPAPYTGIDVGFSSLWLEGPATASFVEDVVSDVAAQFPGPYFHVGGDEAKVTAEADYASFIVSLQAIVAAQGKTLVGWEEIGAAPLDPPFLAQRWLSDEKALSALARGARIIASPAASAYLDMKYDSDTPIGQTYLGFTGVEEAYGWDPVTGDFGEDVVVGVEAPLWTETVESMAHVELLAFPRLAGHAEIAWSPAEGRSWVEYQPRLVRHGARLDALGVGYYRSEEVAW